MPVCAYLQRASLPPQNRADVVLTFKQKQKFSPLKEQLQEKSLHRNDRVRHEHSCRIKQQFLSLNLMEKNP